MTPQTWKLFPQIPNQILFNLQRKNDVCDILFQQITFAWFATRQFSQTFTLCSKQNRLVTFFLGHLQSPIFLCFSVDNFHRKFERGGKTKAQTCICTESVIFEFFYVHL